MSHGIRVGLRVLTLIRAQFTAENDRIGYEARGLLLALV